MNTGKSLRTLAIVSVLIGVLFLSLVISMVVSVETLATDSDRGHKVLPLIGALIIAPTGIPPLMATIYGIRLFRSPSKAAVKGTIGGLSILGSSVIVLSIQRFFTLKIEGNFTFFLVAILALPIYVYSAKFVITRFLELPLVPGEFVGRGIKGLISIQTGLAYSSLIMDKMSDGPPWLPLTPFLVGSLCYYILLGFGTGPRTATTDAG